jgi:hypothetical protein
MFCGVCGTKSTIQPTSIQMGGGLLFPSIDYLHNSPEFFLTLSFEMIIIVIQ